MFRLKHTLLVCLVVTIASLLDFSCLAQDKANRATPEPQLTIVVAEGAGLTADEALKDAFRNAVRQVVGTFVDAETLIKNDQIIEDKVLTYSGGFVKKYDEIAGTKTSKGGIQRLRIKAQVERSEVVSKLRLERISVKDVDGQSLFAEAVTATEASQDARNLIAKSIQDLPHLLTAKVAGKPNFDRVKSEVLLDIDLEVDQKAYSDFAKRLQAILQKVSFARETVLVKKDPGLSKVLQEKVLGNSVARIPSGLLGPPIPPTKSQPWCVWICESRSGDQSSQRWNGYAVDADLESAILPLMNRRYLSPQYQEDLPDEGKTIVKIELQNDEGATLADDEFEVAFGHINFPSEDEKQLPERRLPWGLDLKYRLKTSPVLHPCHTGPSHLSSTFRKSKKCGYNIDEFVPCAYVAPFSLWLSMEQFNRNETGGLEYLTKQKYQRRIRLNVDDLSAIKKVNCSVVYSSSHGAKQ